MLIVLSNAFRTSLCGWIPIINYQKYKIMQVQDLSAEQLTQLKQEYLLQTNDSISWEELAIADQLISDDFIIEEYSGISFISEDF